MNFSIFNSLGLLRMRKMCAEVALLFRRSNNDGRPIFMAFHKYEESSDHKSKEEKSPIMIMHGLFGSKKNWHNVSKLLNASTGRTVYAIDLRNHGDSPHSRGFSYALISEDIRHTLQTLGVEKVNFMGHSTGGRSGIYFSLKYPDYLESLIVIDISPYFNSPSLLRLLNIIKQLKSIQIDPSLGFSEGKKEARDQLSKSIRSSILINFLLINLYKSENGFKWKLNLDSLEEHFYEITQSNVLPGTFEKPVLFVVGAKGDFVPRSEEEKIKKLFPNAQFLHLNTGHWVHAEDHQGLVNGVTDFLAKK